MYRGTLWKQARFIPVHLKSARKCLEKFTWKLRICWLTLLPWRLLRCDDLLSVSSLETMIYMFYCGYSSIQGDDAKAISLVTRALAIQNNLSPGNSQTSSVLHN